LKSRLSRRQFVVGSLALSGAAAGAASASARRTPAHSRGGKELYGISLAQWSLHRALRGGELEHLDFPQVARQRYDNDAVEYVSTFFARPPSDFSYLGELAGRCRDAGVRSVLIMVDGEGELGDADDTRRDRAVRRHFKWIAAARYLGCHAIRVNAGGEGSYDELMRRAADSLHRLAEVGDEFEIDVIVENHGGLSSNGRWLAATIEAADHPRCGTLPDFGNFEVGGEEVYDRYRGVRELMPFARAVSAKSYAFDEGGAETTIDYPRMMRIVVDAGYTGRVGIEYEGDAHSEDEGIRRTKALLERVRAELAEGR
jgi:sugar phosphate isomerase/epimerase